MKNSLSLLLVLIGLTLLNNPAHAQKVRPKVGVINIETKGIPYDPQQAGNLTRIELEKLDTFDVADKYDIIAIAEKEKLNLSNCYGKQCLIETGKALKMDYMLTGSAELYGQNIVITYRLIDVNREVVEKTSVIEFLNLPLELQQMIGISMRKMFGYANDKALFDRLTKKFNYESSVNNPYSEQLELEGPRFGFTVPVGPLYKTLSRSKANGGLGYENPTMFQFGYQFEKQYLNEGNWQALFEFLPMITGIEQGAFLPSLTFMNGFRNNKSGWEIAIGPSFSVGKYADVKIIGDKAYTRQQLEENQMTYAEADLTRMMHNEGSGQITTALIIAFGKTFKSGKMNIPFNLWFTYPTNEGFRIGISAGYNAKKSK